MTTLIDLLTERATRHGSRPAFVYLEDGTTEAGAWTFADLDRRARAVAAELQAAGARGERAVLLYPAGLDFLAGLFGCLYAGVIAIPAPPPEASRAKRTWPRLRAIAKDAKAAWVLTTAGIRELAADAEFNDPPARWLVTDAIADARAADWKRPEVDPKQPAYLQYTSGSTATPRGVAISHRNLLHHLGILQSNCGYGPDSVTVTWMPNFHDYGLVEGLLEPLYNATPCYVMSPFAFVKRPHAWLGALTRYYGTHSQAPNFAFDHCVRRISEVQKKALDLSSWVGAGCAAEPINPRVMRAFAEAFGPCGFRWPQLCAAYGLAEATLLVSTSPVGAEPTVARLRPEALEAGRIEDAPAGAPGPVREVFGCGAPLVGMKVKIVDPESRTPSGPGRVGEVWVGGPSVAEGYWGRPDETEETFRATTTDGDGPYLRTGDLGFVQDGQLYITGRRKDLVIVRGTNHYPQDLEWTAQRAHPALRPENGAAFSVIVDGEERLVLALEVERAEAAGLDHAAVVEAVRRAITEEHELDVYAVSLLTRATLPKTASGKIQRTAARAAFLAGGDGELHRWTAPVKATTAGRAGGVSPLLPSPLAGEGGPPQADRVRGTPPKTPPHPLHFVELPSPARGEGGDRTDALIGWLREYAATRINSRLMDERRCIPPYIVLDFGNRGVLGLQVPESHGGIGLGYRDALRVLEQLAAIDLTLATVVLLHNSNGIRPVQFFAKPALRDEWLPRLASGRELSAFALSEPGAGANVAGLRTTATPDGAGGWRLRGVKRWNAASWAGLVNVFARPVGPDGRPGGLTGFAVRQGSPGFRVGPEALTMGLRGSVQNSIFLDDVPVSAADILGEPGKGMVVADDALTIGRLYIAAACVGAMKRCFQLVHRYADRRPIATGKLADHPVTRVRLGRTAARIAAVDALVGRIAADLDAGLPVPMDAMMAAKVAGSDGAIDAANDLMQALGGRGYMENNVAPQLLRDARLMSIGEGPNETLTGYVGRTAGQTDTLTRLLADRWGAPGVAAQLADAAAAVTTRCQGPDAPFADRAAALSWAHAVAGHAATEAMLVAARGADATDPDRRRLDAALAACHRGSPEEADVLPADQVAALAVGYAGSIGDVEQDLPGEEDWIEPVLRTSFAPPAPAADLPGAFAPPAAAGPDLAPEAKRALLARLLRRAAPATLESSPETAR